MPKISRPQPDRQSRSDEIRELLRMLDEDAEDVSTWEADFIESVAYGEYTGPLSTRQVETAENILEKYGFPTELRR